MAAEVSYIKLQIKPGAANPSPPVGPALGQHGVNIKEFCTAFNNATAHMPDKDMPLPIVITVQPNRTFTFVIKTPPASNLLLKAVGATSGSARPHTDKIGQLSRAQLRDIAQLKMPDLNTHTIEAAMRIIAGTARSMGIEIESGENA